MTDLVERTGVGDEHETVHRRADAEPATSATPEPLTRRVRVRRSGRRFLVLPVAAVLLALSAPTLTVWWSSRRGVEAYEAGQYGAGRAAFERTQVADLVDEWKAWLGIGDSYFGAGDLAAAEEAFARALQADRTRCDVRFNLTVTIEAQGDVMMGGNVRDVTDADETAGLARYRVALDIANGAECPSDGPGSAGERLAETRERIGAKLGAETLSQEDSTMDDPDGNDRERTENDTDTQQDAIRDRNETGAAERQDSSDVTPDDDQPPRDPNW